MKKLLLSALLLLAFTTTNAQNKFSVDVNYPFLIGDNSTSDALNGTIDLGVKWNFIHISKLDLGLGVDYGYLNGDTFDGNASYVKPKVNAEIKILKLSPYAQLGYTFVNTSFDGGGSASNDGINATIGLKWHIFIPKLYINAAYDYTSFSDGDGSYEKSFAIGKIGIGLQL